MFSDKYCLNMSDNLLDTMMKLDKINSSVKINFVKLDLSSTSSSVRIMLSMSTLKWLPMIFEKQGLWWKLFNREDNFKIEKITFKLLEEKEKMNYRNWKQEEQL